jgi:hypothetical protein
MKKKTLALIIVLVVPLALYFIPYAYAATTIQNTYAENSAPQNLASGAGSSFVVQCASTSDFTLHYIDSHPGLVKTVHVISLNSARNPINNGETPNGWDIGLVNIDAGPITESVTIFCQTPITTVAGIGIPEFGQLYIAIALGALVFYLMGRYMTRKASVVPFPSPNVQ